MKIMKKITINQGQIGLLTKAGNFQQLLTSGDHSFTDWFNKLEIKVFELNNQPIEEKLAEHLRQYHTEWIECYFIDVQISDDEMGLLYLHSSLSEILPPATRRLYWKNGDALRIEKQATDDVAIDKNLLSRLKVRKGLKGLEHALISQIPAWHLGVLKIAGEVQSLLNPGLYGYWRFSHGVEIETIDTRYQSVEITGQEILTRDKVTLRVNLSANWRYNDILQACSRLTKPVEYLYRELQFALREAIGTRSLDELLENKNIVDELIMTQMIAKMPDFGLEVASVGVKDIILPGDMRNILSQVVEAEKSAQANVIRRREETAATRSLLNTAKVMENNPVALRLKELETLENIAHRIDQISVYGGLDGVLNGLVNIKDAK